MKVINHHDGNYKSMGSDGCVYYGTIIMTEVEYRKAMDDILAYAWSHMTYEIKNILWILDEPPYICPFTRKKMACFRVTFTEILFKIYNLPRYKKQNYRIIITK